MTQVPLFEPSGRIAEPVREHTGGRTREGLPWSGSTAISRHRSAQAAQAASATRVTKTLRYMELVEKAGRRGLSDHEAQRAMGVPLSSICSIRNGSGPLIEANPDDTGESPYGRLVTLWRRRA